MHTRESAKLRMLFAGQQPEQQAAGSALGLGLMEKLRGAESGVEWPTSIHKEGGVVSRETMCLALRNGREIEVESIGKGIHRPYKVTFKDGFRCGPINTKRAVLKTIYCQFENKRYCQSVDTKITGPEREILSFELDKIMGFDLVPPTIGREIERVGAGSVQAWVDQPTAWQWLERGYNYREDKSNPWLHRLAAFDFIRGEIDRHANNWIMDEERRVYAIDNGYSFVKGDDRTWLRTSAGKHLIGTPIHPTVQAEIGNINEVAIYATMSQFAFSHGEQDGVVKRIRELKGLRTWKKLGDLWC